MECSSSVGSGLHRLFFFGDAQVVKVDGITCRGQSLVEGEEEGDRRRRRTWWYYLHGQAGWVAGGVLVDSHLLLSTRNWQGFVSEVILALGAILCPLPKVYLKHTNGIRRFGIMAKWMTKWRGISTRRAACIRELCHVFFLARLRRVQVGCEKEYGHYSSIPPNAQYLLHNSLLVRASTSM